MRVFHCKTRIFPFIVNFLWEDTLRLCKYLVSSPNFQPLFSYPLIFLAWSAFYSGGCQMAISNSCHSFYIYIFCHRKDRIPSFSHSFSPLLIYVCMGSWFFCFMGYNLFLSLFFKNIHTVADLASGSPSYGFYVLHSVSTFLFSGILICSKLILYLPNSAFSHFCKKVWLL